jgi:hypothetical protein
MPWWKVEPHENYCVYKYYIFSLPAFDEKHAKLVQVWFVVFNATFNNISAISTIYPSNIVYYHIFCCNMFVSACPIIAKSQCWLFALRANTGQISIFALKYPYLLSYIRICPLIQLPASAQWSQSTKETIFDG